MGATRERTTAALADLAGHGMIQPRWGKIVIRDPSRLAAYADGAHPKGTTTREHHATDSTPES